MSAQHLALEGPLIPTVSRWPRATHLRPREQPGVQDMAQTRPLRLLQFGSVSHGQAAWGCLSGGRVVLVSPGPPEVLWGPECPRAPGLKVTLWPEGSLPLLCIIAGLPCVGLCSRTLCMCGWGLWTAGGPERGRTRGHSLGSTLG